MWIPRQGLPGHGHGANSAFDLPYDISRNRRAHGVQGRSGAYDATMNSQNFTHEVDFICPHCEAQYIVNYTELPVADSDSVYCEVCKRRMVQWNSALQPRYRLVNPPDRK
jgi:predicted Zn finger-like uncharacterized protein